MNNPDDTPGDRVLSEGVEVLVREMLVDDGVRLPGARREALLQAALQNGIDVGDAMLASLQTA